MYFVAEFGNEYLETGGVLKTRNNKVLGLQTSCLNLFPICRNLRKNIHDTNTISAPCS